MSNFASISAQIVTVIDAIKAANNIDAVYNHNPNSFDGTPVVIVVPSLSGEEITTTDKNELSTNFVVRCLVENSGDQSTQTARLLTVVDAVMAELRKDDNETLGGLCHYFLVEEISSIEFGEVQEMKVMFMDLLVSARHLNSITTP